jgi:hypothetical protein
MRGKILFFLAIMVCLAADSAEVPPKAKNFDFLRIKATAEHSVRRFNPGFVSAYYRARVYAIHDYHMRDSLTVDSLPIIKDVAGYLPVDSSAGPLHVSFIAESKGHGRTLVDTVYEYRMESPLYTRKENGMERGLFQVKAGSFLVPLPAAKNITNIVIEDEDGIKLVSKFR